jgi:hypothetical protein
MTRESSKQTKAGLEDAPEETSREYGEPIEKAASAEAKQKKPRRQKAKIEEPVGPLPDEAQPAPEPPKVAQQDAAKAFMAATSKSQAFAVATEGLLGAVHLGLPDPDVYFRTKPIEKTINSKGEEILLNQAVVSMYKLPDGARVGSEPRLWLVAESLVSAFKERNARIRSYQLRLAVDRQGTPYLIPVPLDAHDIWATSLKYVLTHSDTKWLKIFSHQKTGRRLSLATSRRLSQSTQWRTSPRSTHSRLCRSISTTRITTFTNGFAAHRDLLFSAQFRTHRARIPAWVADRLRVYPPSRGPP